MKPYHRKPQNPEIIPVNVVCQWQGFSNTGLLYITGKLSICRIQW